MHVGDIPKTETLREGERHISPWMEGARFKETMLKTIILLIPRPTLNYRFELVTLGSETPTGRYLVAVGDIPGQLGLKYIGHATLGVRKRVLLNFNARKKYVLDS